jgi:5-hydroxyisourate hydrolase-like protein (transthyretin family)
LHNLALKGLFRADSTIIIITRTPKPTPIVPPIIHEKQDNASTETERATENKYISPVKADEDKKISGIVTSRDGVQIPEATVEVLLYGEAIGETKKHSPADNPWAVSNVNGVFEIAGLKKDGVHSLKATAKGYAEVIVKGIRVGSRDVAIIMSPEAVISGTVFHEETEEALAGIKVHLLDTARSPYDKYTHWEVTSDTDGLYIFQGLPASETYVIEAMGNGLVAEPLYIELEDEEQKLGIDLELYPLLSISGKVVLEGTDTPVPGIKIWLMNTFKSRHFYLKYAFSGAATSDTDGKFSFSGLSEGGYRLQVINSHKYRIVVENDNTTIFAGKGGGPKYPKLPLRLTLEKDQRHKLIVVELEQRTSISGTVSNDEGEPIKEVRVVPTEIKGHRTLNYNAGHTDADGKYIISGLSPEVDKYSVRFEHGNYLPLEETIVFEDHEWEKVLDVVLDPGLFLFGQITDTDSEPVENATIFLESMSEMGGRPRVKSTVSDTEGYYLVSGLTAGSWRVRAKKEGYSSARIDGIVVEDEDLDEIDLTLIKLSKGKPISGKIFIGENIPLASHQVSFLFSRTTTIARYIETDKDGVFIISDISEGTYDLSLYATYKTTSRHIDLRKEYRNISTGTEDLIIRFEGFGSIAGIVRDAVTFEPVADGTISARRWRDKEQRYRGIPGGPSSSSSDGTFILELLHPGKYLVRIVTQKHITKEVKNIIVTENQITEGTDILLERGCQVKGRVLTADTLEPLKKANLLLTGTFCDSQPYKRRRSTNENGLFVFETVPEGQNYTLNIEHKDYVSKVIKPIRARADTPFEVGDIPLDTGSIIEGNVTDKDGNAFEGAAISLSKQGVNKKQAITDRNGYYIIKGVPEGETAIRCHWIRNQGHYHPYNNNGKEITEEKKITVYKNQPIKVDFTLNPPIEKQQ